MENKDKFFDELKNMDLTDIKSKQITLTCDELSRIICEFICMFEKTTQGGKSNLTSDFKEHMSKCILADFNNQKDVQTFLLKKAKMAELEILMNNM